jgi:hypothetical protein
MLCCDAIFTLDVGSIEVALLLRGQLRDRMRVPGDLHGRHAQHADDG